MILDKSHTKSSNIDVSVLHFMHVVGLELFLLGSYRALIFCNPKLWYLTASALYSNCGRSSLKNSITVLGVDVKGIPRDTLKARRDSLSWVPAHVWQGLEWSFTPERGTGFWKAPGRTGVSSAPQDLPLSQRSTEIPVPESSGSVRVMVCPEIWGLLGHV